MPVVTRVLGTVLPTDSDAKVVYNNGAPSSALMPQLLSCKPQGASLILVLPYFSAAFPAFAVGQEIVITAPTGTMTIRKLAGGGFELEGSGVFEDNALLKVVREQ